MMNMASGGLMGGAVANAFNNNQQPAVPQGGAAAYCPKCGQGLPADANFCTKCGNQVK